MQVSLISDERRRINSLRNTFITSYREWLEPLGFTEIYSINHPTLYKDEVHFIKHCVRVVCKRDTSGTAWHLHADTLNSKHLSLTLLLVGKLGDTATLNEQIKYMRKLLKLKLIAK